MEQQSSSFPTRNRHEKISNVSLATQPSTHLRICNACTSTSARETTNPWSAREITNQVGVISQAAREMTYQVGVISRAARWLENVLFLIKKLIITNRKRHNGVAFNTTNSCVHVDGTKLFVRAHECTPRSARQITSQVGDISRAD